MPKEVKLVSSTGTNSITVQDEAEANDLQNMLAKYGIKVEIVEQTTKKNA